MTEQMEYSAYKQYLVNGEYVLWQGRPEKGNLLSKSDIFMIPFSIIWCGFAIFWETTAIMGGAPFFFALWGIPFVCVGLYIVFGRFIWTAWTRKRTHYVITNKKIIRMCGRKMDMLDGKSLPAMYIEIHGNGNGTIKFGTPDPYYGRYRNTWSAAGNALFSLENLSDFRQVQQAIANMDK